MYSRILRHQGIFCLFVSTPSLRKSQLVLPLPTWPWFSGNSLEIKEESHPNSFVGAPYLQVQLKTANSPAYSLAL